MKTAPHRFSAFCALPNQILFPNVLLLVNLCDVFLTFTGNDFLIFSLHQERSIFEWLAFESPTSLPPATAATTTTSTTTPTAERKRIFQNEEISVNDRRRWRRFDIWYIVVFLLQWFHRWVHTYKPTMLINRTDIINDPRLINAGSSFSLTFLGSFVTDQQKILLRWVSQSFNSRNLANSLWLIKLILLPFH